MNQFGSDTCSKGNDMNEEMKLDVYLHFEAALKKFVSENEIAQYLQNSFQEKYHGVWHCIIGKDFGSSVVYEENYHFGEKIGLFQVELWKCS